VAPPATRVDVPLPRSLMDALARSSRRSRLPSAQVLLELAVEGLKCVSNLVVLFHGTVLYCSQPNDQPAKGQQMV
jgi:hypothetical protein